MNFYQRIQCKFNYLLDDRYIKQQQQVLFDEVRKCKGMKTIYFFCVPRHSNLGDQAQYMCWLRLFATHYPEYHVVNLPDIITTDNTLSEIQAQITSNDRIYIHSGYLIFDPHPELPFIIKIVDMFHNIPITILPQTINLISEKKKKEVADCFNAHPYLTIVSRDEISLQKAHVLFPNSNRLLWPDVVTSLIGDKDFLYQCNHRSGIMFCIRNDGEKFYDEEKIAELKTRFRKTRIDENDTTIILPQRFWNEKREILIRQIISAMGTYQLIITDRYHGVIFSQVANTPVIVLSSTDHKLSSGVKWFPKELFGENVFYANNLEECYNLAQMILQRKNSKFTLNFPYFKNKYYNTKF